MSRQICKPETMSFNTLLRWLLAVVIDVAVVVVVLFVINRVLGRTKARYPRLWNGWRRVRRPLAAVLISTSLRVAVAATTPSSTLRTVAMHVLLIAVIIFAVWLVAAVALYGLSLSAETIAQRKEDDLDRRRSQTQLQLIQRLVSAAFVVVGIGLVLLTFPGVERVGAGVLASAGLLSVVAGLAAQSSLANLFAGIQLAFSDAIRIGDVVEMEQQWGKIEEITLTYVVVRIWDERMLILPSTYVTTTPFTNWTRTGTGITGVVLFEVDWRVDLERMRGHFEELIAASDLFDGRSHSLLVTDATGGRLTVRAVVSAANSADLWDLRCLVREQLASWLRVNHPEALPVQRLDLDAAPGVPSVSPDPRSGTP